MIVLEAEKEKEQIQVEVDASNEKLKEAEKVVTDLEVAIKVRIHPLIEGY